MPENFKFESTPNQPSPIPQTPVSSNVGSNENFAPPSQVRQAPRQETISSWNSNPIARTRTTRKAAQTIVFSRSRFKQDLQEKGLGLFTSAIEFQNTGSFIQSSYVEYPNFNNYKEPLAEFIQRYPSFADYAMALDQELRTLQNQMQIKNNPNNF